MSPEHRSSSDAALPSAIASLARPLRGDRDFDPIVAAARDADVVLLGEASHGTHEFYAARAAISQRLIREAGFDAIAIEGDWPDARRVHRYVTEESSRTAAEALSGFERFPTWMWRNTDFVDFVGALRDHVERGGDVGFYGLDLYALDRSRACVLAYLDALDPEAAQRARARYACFDRFDDPQEYGYAATLGLSASCEEAVVQQLLELQARMVSDEHPALWDALQNARLVVDAERYYRTMFRGNVASWNLRDTHMAETLDALIERRRAARRPGRVVVWAHNSHLGDARATDRALVGELNVGQLAREKYGARALLVGFSTYDGTVTAARDWDHPPERRTANPGLPGSCEALFHEAAGVLGDERFLLDLRALGEASGALRERRLQRAIGVVYMPDTERTSHYYHVRLAEQFDFLLHYDHTRAVEPLDHATAWRHDEPPETYPVGL